MSSAIASGMERALWTGYCLVFAYFIAGGAWILAAGMLGGILLTAAALYAHKVLIVLWLISMPSLFVQADRFIKGAGVPVITADRALMGFLIGFLVLRLITSGARLPRLSTLEKWMAALLGVVLLSYLSTIPERSWADLYQGAVLIVEGYVTPLAAYVLARSQTWSERELRILLALLALLAVYLAAAGVLQYFFGLQFFSPTWLGVGADTDRATSGFGSPVEFGLVMSMLLALCLLNLQRQSDAFKRTLALAATAAATLGVLLSLTRAAWLAALVAIAWIFWKDPRTRGVLVRGGIAGVFAGILALAFFVRTDVFEQRLTELSPIYNRIALWSTAGNMIIQNPVFGVGFGHRTFNDNKREYLVAVGPSAMGKYALEPGVPHNEFLHVLAMTGMTGFAPYFMVWLLAWRLTRACGRSVEQHGALRAELATYVQAMILIVLVGGMFSELWTFRYLLGLVLFMVGVLASRRLMSDEAPRPIGVGVVTAPGALRGAPPR